MQQLEWFQYVTVLDLNMEYNTIRILTDTQGMMMIVTEFGNFRQNCLTVGMCASEYIFQAKVEELLGDIEGIKTNINDIRILSNDCF